MNVAYPITKSQKVLGYLAILLVPAIISLAITGAISPTWGILAEIGALILFWEAIK